MIREMDFASGSKIDLSDTTATESDVKDGKVFHLADGSSAIGTYVPISEMPLLCDNRTNSKAVAVGLDNLNGYSSFKFTNLVGSPVFYYYPDGVETLAYADTEYDLSGLTSCRAFMFVHASTQEGATIVLKR